MSRSYLIAFKRLFRSFLPLLLGLKLSQVTVVISFPTNISIHFALYDDAREECLFYFLHLVIENGGFSRGSVRDEMLINDAENVLTNVRELVLYLLAIPLDCFHV